MIDKSKLSRYDPLLVIIDKMVFAGLFIPQGIAGEFGIITPAASRFGTYCSIWFYKDETTITKAWPPMVIKLPETEEDKYACERLKERWMELTKSANPKFEAHDLEPIRIL